MNEKKLGGIYAIDNKKLQLEMLKLNSYGRPCDNLDKFKNEVFRTVNPASNGHKDRYVVCLLPMVYDFDLENEVGVASVVDAAESNMGLILEGWTTIVWDRYSGRVHSFEQNEYIYGPLLKFLDSSNSKSEKVPPDDEDGPSRETETGIRECFNALHAVKKEFESLAQASREGGRPNLVAAERQVNKSLDQVSDAINNLSKALGSDHRRDTVPVVGRSKMELVEAYNKLKGKAKTLERSISPSVRRRKTDKDLECRDLMSETLLIEEAGDRASGMINQFLNLMLLHFETGEGRASAIALAESGRIIDPVASACFAEARELLLRPAESFENLRANLFAALFGLDIAASREPDCYRAAHQAIRKLTFTSLDDAVALELKADDEL